MLLNTNSTKAGIQNFKGTQEEKEDATGICVDRKHIIRELTASFVPTKKSKNQLATYYLNVPKAPSSDIEELSNNEISLNDTLARNKLVRAKRRGINPFIITDDGNEALSNALEEVLGSELSQALSTLDSDSLSGSEPDKKKTRRTSVESSTVEDLSSKPRRVFMHGGRNNGKTPKPWDKEAERHRSVSNL